MFKKYLLIASLCLSITSMYASKPNGGGCNTNNPPLTFSSPAANIATADQTCTSGFCNLKQKKCKAKKASNAKCNRAAQCSSNSCVNNKCA